MKVAGKITLVCMGRSFKNLVISVKEKVRISRTHYDTLVQRDSKFGEKNYRGLVDNRTLSNENKHNSSNPHKTVSYKFYLGDHKVTGYTRLSKINVKGRK